MNSNALMSNGFTETSASNVSVYKHHINEEDEQEPLNSKFISTPSGENRRLKSNQRSGSLIARSATYSNVSCPHCERKFSAAAAERHIPVCQNIFHKPKTLRKSSQKSSKVNLPNLSQTNYKNGFDDGLMDNTPSTLRTSNVDPSKKQLTQTTGLPPTYKPPGSKSIAKTRKDFAVKKCFCTSCGHKYRSEEKF
mmetsp:Transcript_27151/g.31328  ORF Transcript_27151/g.31328 Transcript_27151/m.31328 type:complete len:194 (-) Transcript_27151:68-649(-)